MKAQLRLHNGTPTVFFDDKPSFFGCHLVGGMDPKNPNQHQEIARKYAEAGVHIYSVDNINNYEWCDPKEGIHGPYDFTTVRPRLQGYIDVDPEATFLMRMCFETRWIKDDWWNRAYPGELEVTSDGKRWAQSFASTVWRSQVNELLRAFIAWLKKEGLYDRIVGFQIGAGSSGEWIKDTSTMNQPTNDYSEPMRRHFRAWLADRYHTDAGLQAAWRDPAATLAAAEVPSHQEQVTTTTGHSFRHPHKERKTIDFYDCLAELCADDLGSFAHTVRDATSGEKLIGGFFGYVMELAWNMAFFANGQPMAEADVSTIQKSGHLGLHRLLHSPDIDFLVSPYGYAFRGLGGDCLPMQPGESLRAHGKIYLMEEDTLMHNNFDPGGRNQSMENSIAVYQRNFAQALTHGQAVTWFEVQGLQEAEALVPERKRWIRRFQELGQWGIGLDREPQAEVAVFLDDESYFHESIQNKVDIPLIWRQRVITLNRFGAPHDVYFLDDLLDDDGSARLPDYKLYVFLNPFHLDDARRAKLKKVLRRNGKVALWLYAPGYLNTDSAAPLSVNNMTDLTGITFGQGDSPWGPFMHVTNFQHPITRGLPQDWFWGTTNPIGPLFHVEDPSAATLGQVVYALGRCKPGFAVKTFGSDTAQDSWSSVYCATPDIPAPVLRGIARFAGVHLYNEDGDVLYATPELLSVHSVSGGKREFRLPGRVEVVYDLFGEKVLAKRADRFTVTLPPASTSLYFTGAKAKLPKTS
jgi:hypothetical protein